VAIDYQNFRPESVGELSGAIGSELSVLGKKWWAVNSELIAGYVASLSEATLQTQIALESGRIKPDQADRIMHMQQIAFKSTIHFTKYMTFALAQKVLDETFKIIGWALYNRTGVNLFPQLVKET